MVNRFDQWSTDLTHLTHGQPIRLMVNRFDQGSTDGPMVSRLDQWSTGGPVVSRKEARNRSRPARSRWPPEPARGGPRPAPLPPRHLSVRVDRDRSRATAGRPPGRPGAVDGPPAGSPRGPTGGRTGGWPAVEWNAGPARLGRRSNASSRMGDSERRATRKDRLAQSVLLVGRARPPPTVQRLARGQPVDPWSKG